MIRFDCDYTEGCHPRILEALTRTNAEQHPGYGTDAHCARARALIREACAVSDRDADVHFLVGGTQTNATVIAAVLRNFAELPLVRNAFAGIRVCVCALILNAVLKLRKKALVDLPTTVIFLIVLALAVFTKLSPVIFVVAAALAGVAVKAWGAKK